MGRFAHLLNQEVFETRATPPVPVTAPRATPPVPHHVAPEDSQAWHVQTVPANAPTKEKCNRPNGFQLQPSLATDHLLQQITQQVIGLQVLEDDQRENIDSDGAGRVKDPCTPQQNSVDLPSAARTPEQESVVEAELILPGFGQSESKAGPVPFELGLGQMHSAYAVERFVDNGGEHYLDEQDSSETSTSEDTVSCDASHSDPTELPDSQVFNREDASLSTKDASWRVAVPRVVPYSTWSKGSSSRESTVCFPTTVPLGTSYGQMNVDSCVSPGSEIDKELAYIKEAIAKSEKLLRGPRSVVNSVGKESVQDGTNTSQVPVTESQHQTGTVGLLVWPSKNQELVVTGFKHSSQAASSGILLGDVIVEINGENVQRCAPAEITERMTGQVGSHVTVHVSRIVEGSKSINTYVVYRDVLKLVESEAESLQILSPGRDDPIITSLQGASQGRKLLYHNTQNDVAVGTLISVDHRPADAREMYAQCQFPSEMVNPRFGKLFAEESEFTSKEERVAETSLGKTQRECMDTGEYPSTPEAYKHRSPGVRHESPAPPPLLSPVQQVQFQFRRTLGQIQNTCHATAQPQARTPVARLQMIPSPASRLRTDLCSPLHGSMAQYDPVKATPLKSLHTSAAPAGAKPRRANGECPEMSVLHDENQAPDDPHVSSPTGLHPIQSQLKVTCVNTCSNRPPLLPVRSVGEMAQPRIMDSTDLHLEFVADEPMVTGCAVNAARISVGVQKNDASCQSKHVHNDADVVYAQIEKDVGNDYSVDVIEDLEIISNGRHLQRQNSELNGQNSILALCTRADSNSINQPVSSFSGPFSTNAENSIFSRQHRKGEEYGRSMIKRFRPKGNRHMNQSAPRGFDQDATSSHFRKSSWRNAPRRHYSNQNHSRTEDRDVADLLNSTIAELEVGC